MKILFIFIVVFISGGCSLSPETETSAAEEFTKSYLSSEKTAEDGYDLFESKTGGYTMLFPEDAVVSEHFGNEKRNDAFESIMYGYRLNGASVSTRITYENKPGTRDIQEKQRLLSVSAGYDGAYEVIQSKGKTIYFAEKRTVLKNSNGHVYLGFIKASDSGQAVEFTLNARCKRDDQSCQPPLKNTALKLMKSVQFNGRVNGT
ncbi:hypothetical protein GKZ89_16860 [Bacillus mangrovi]|uniref:Lipoprotein n=1 Tax=Metabacillus mangrovi TaxID=1491830 RepID=A0A7X2V5R6_9BACI|nr:hypothetical protein [Metabacillus mangrovi]MTH55077.1 hypothetical protein [Metabacillus mangrovi]